MTEVTLAKRKTFGLLINRNFTWLWIGQSISQVGDWFFRITLYLWILKQLAPGRSWAALAVGGITIATALPALLVGPVTGVFVDRWDRRKTMMGMDALRALLVALFLVVSLLVGSASWLLISLFLVVILTSICSQFFDPANIALVASIVPADRRSDAIALLRQAYFFASIFGPSLATIFYFTFGPQWAFGLDAVSFVASLLALLVMQVPAQTGWGVREKHSFRHDFMEGLRFFVRTPAQVPLVISRMISNFAGFAFNSISILFVVENLHTLNNLTGLYEPAYGIGAIIGLPVAAWLVRRLGEGRLLWVSFVAWGSFLLILSRMSNLWMGFVGFGLLGLSNMGIIASLNPLMMLVTPGPFLGRVQAFSTPLATGAGLLGAAIVSSLAALASLRGVVLGIRFGPVDTIFAGIGVMMIVAGIYSLCSLGTLRSPRIEPKESLSEGGKAR